jgi:hypothetical protein
MMTPSAPSNCLVSKMADAVLEGKAMRKDQEPEELPMRKPT